MKNKESNPIDEDVLAKQRTSGEMNINKELDRLDKVLDDPDYELTNYDMQVISVAKKLSEDQPLSTAETAFLMGMSRMGVDKLVKKATQVKMRKKITGDPVKYSHIQKDRTADYFVDSKIYEDFTKLVGEADKEPYTYEDVANEMGLTGKIKERYLAYMNTRWPKFIDTGYSYAAEWAERFRDGREYIASDSAGFRILQKIDGTGPKEEMNEQSDDDYGIAGKIATYYDETSGVGPITDEFVIQWAESNEVDLGDKLDTIRQISNEIIGYEDEDKGSEEQVEEIEEAGPAADQPGQESAGFVNYKMNEDKEYNVDDEVVFTIHGKMYAGKILSISGEDVIVKTEEPKGTYKTTLSDIRAGKEVKDEGAMKSLYTKRAYQGVERERSPQLRPWFKKSLKSKPAYEPEKKQTLSEEEIEIAGEGTYGQHQESGGVIAEHGGEAGQKPHLGGAEIIHDMPALTLSDIINVYVGKPNRCMCGCSGKYYDSSKNPENRHDINDAKVMRVYNKIKSNEGNGIEVHENRKILLTQIGGTFYALYLVNPIEGEAKEIEEAGQHENQDELDKIQSWLADTTQEFDDWDWNGTELVVFLNGKAIEKYSKQDLIDAKVIEEAGTAAKDIEEEKKSDTVKFYANSFDWKHDRDELVKFCEKHQGKGLNIFQVDMGDDSYTIIATNLEDVQEVAKRFNDTGDFCASPDDISSFDYTDVIEEAGPAADQPGQESAGFVNYKDMNEEFKHLAGLDEGSYHDFIAQYGRDIQQLLKKAKVEAARIEKEAEGKPEGTYEQLVGDKLKRVESIYDKPVADMIEKMLAGGSKYFRADVQSVADIALRINNNYGTEMKQVVNALADVFGDAGGDEDTSEAVEKNYTCTKCGKGTDQDECPRCGVATAEQGDQIDAADLQDREEMSESHDIDCPNCGSSLGNSNDDALQKKIVTCSTCGKSVKNPEYVKEALGELGAIEEEEVNEQIPTQTQPTAQELPKYAANDKISIDGIPPGDPMAGINGKSGIVISVDGESTTIKTDDGRDIQMFKSEYLKKV